MYTQHSPHCSTHTHTSMGAHLRLALKILWRQPRNKAFSRTVFHRIPRRGHQQGQALSQLLLGLHAHGGRLWTCLHLPMVSTHQGQAPGAISGLIPTHQRAAKTLRFRFRGGGSGEGAYMIGWVHALHQKLSARQINQNHADWVHISAPSALRSTRVTWSFLRAHILRYCWTLTSG